MNDLPATGERFIPEKMNDPATVTEHYQRYNAALSLVKDKIVLDIASGAGYGTHFLSSAARMAYGVEIDQKAVDYSREHYAKSNLKYLQGSVEHIPLEDHSVDVVVSFETIEHVSAELQVRMMEEIKRVLKDDGILFISSPEKRYYSEERGYVNPYHVHELYASEFKDLLEKHFSHIKFAGQRFLYGCCAIWNDNTSGNMVLCDSLTQTQSTELSKPHYILAVAGNHELPDVFNSIVEYDPDSAFWQELLHKPDPLELFTANQTGEWRSAAFTMSFRESTGSRTDLEIDFTCGELPRLRIDLGRPGYRYKLEKLQIVADNNPVENLLKPDFGSAANALIEFDSNSRDVSPFIIPYTDDPQLFFELPPDFAEKKCRLILSYSMETVVTSDIIARKIGEVNMELARYRDLTSGTFYKLLTFYGKVFPSGSRRRKIIAKPVRILWSSTGMIPKTIKSIRENGLLFTLKKIASFFRAEQGRGWMLDSQKYDMIGTPEPIPAKASLPGKTTVVVPVYNGLDHLKRLMPSLLANTPADVSILMIDDCSPDETVAPFLHAQAERNPRIKLLNNPKNIGFVKTVNLAFELCKDQDYIILLNTDTEVPPQWVERLIAPFEKEADIASVTPFSNGATIFSLPLTDDRNNREFIRVFPLEEIDREIRKYSLPPESRTAPCGVGFCMAMKNELIRQFGGFDEESFGKGFGEEVDWCRRAAEKGFRNVIAPNLFVSHFHGGSFASVERSALLEEHEKLLTKKHPDYHAALAAHELKTAPVWDIVRCVATLGLMLKPEHDPVLILDHDWGGGANLYREKMVRELLANGKAVLLAQNEVGSIKLTAYYRDLSYSYHVRDFATLHLPCFSGIRRIVVNELISWQYIYGKRVFSIDLYRKLIGEILALKDHYGARLEYMFHDFFLICPHLNLVNMNRVYCNPGTSAAPCAGCITVRRHYEKTERYLGTITGELWRDAMRPLIANLDEIRFFSQNSIDVFRQVYAPEDIQIKLVPHKPVISFRPMQFNGGPVRIGCVGAIGEVKGAGFIVELANYLKTHAPDAKIVVIGIIDARCLPDNVIVHGEYELSELPGLLERYGINIGFISSIWPETFSYVTQELMMLGLPLVCFDIGAPRDRIGTWGKGRIIPEMTPESAWTAISELHRTCYQDERHV